MIVVAIAVPPAETISVPCELDSEPVIVVPLSIPPERTTSVPPSLMVAPTARPPKATSKRAAAVDRRAARGAAGLDDLRTAEDRGAAGEAEVKLRAAADRRALIAAARGDRTRCRR